MGSGGGRARPPPPAFPDQPPQLLEARTRKIQFDQVVGTTQVVQSGSGSGAQAGFFCSACNRLCKDNMAYLEHINSIPHLRRTGKKLEIKRATLADVKARLAALKRRRERATEEYDFDKSVAAIKQQQDDETRRRKEAKKEAKRQRQERAGRRKRRPGESDESDDEAQHNGLGGSGEEGDSGSEYSDYEIDEHGNIVETDKPKIKRSAPGRAPEEIEARKEADAASAAEQEEMMAAMGFQGFGSTRKQ